MLYCGMFSNASWSHTHHSLESWSSLSGIRKEVKSTSLRIPPMYAEYQSYRTHAPAPGEPEAHRALQIFRPPSPSPSPSLNVPRDPGPTLGPAAINIRSTNCPSAESSHRKFVYPGVAHHHTQIDCIDRRQRPGAHNGSSTSSFRARAWPVITRCPPRPWG